jgi:hypothetical protein
VIDDTVLKYSFSTDPASEHFTHRGSMYTLIGGQNGDRTLGDFLRLRMGQNGEAEISNADSNNIDEAFVPHDMFVRQNGGNGLLVASSPMNYFGTGTCQRCVRSERRRQV